MPKYEEGYLAKIIKKLAKIIFFWAYYSPKEIKCAWEGHLCLKKYSNQNGIGFKCFCGKKKQWVGKIDKED